MRNASYQINPRKVSEVEKDGHHTNPDMVTVTYEIVLDALLYFVQT